MSITGAGTDCVQVLGVATLTMGHVACTDHMVWLAEAYRARYAAQPQSLCGSVSLVAEMSSLANPCYTEASQDGVRRVTGHQ